MGRFPTLHEAMVEVLRLRDGAWMDRDAIAAEIARVDLWRRPSDGRHPASDQIRLRARKPEYQHLFECSDTACTRIRPRPGASVEARARSARRQRPPRTGWEWSDPPRGSRGHARDSSWYEELRARYRPDGLRVLLIGESPPDPGSGTKRFFYSPELTIDNLYRGVAEAAYGRERHFDVHEKTVILSRLRKDGFWLIDAVEHPVNKLSRGARRRALADAVPRLVERCRELAPERGVIICHSLVYELAAPALRASAVQILHERALPFPLGHWRAQFVAGVRQALA